MKSRIDKTVLILTLLSFGNLSEKQLIERSDNQLDSGNIGLVLEKMQESNLIIRAGTDWEALPPSNIYRILPRGSDLLDNSKSKVGELNQYCYIIKDILKWGILRAKVIQIGTDFVIVEDKKNPNAGYFRRKDIVLTLSEAIAIAEKQRKKALAKHIETMNFLKHFKPEVRDYNEDHE